MNFEPGQTITHRGESVVVRITLRHPDGSITCKLTPTRKPARRSILARLFRL